MILDGHLISSPMTKSSMWEKVLAAAAKIQLCCRRDNHTWVGGGWVVSGWLVFWVSNYFDTWICGGFIGDVGLINTLDVDCRLMISTILVNSPIDNQMEIVTKGRRRSSKRCR